MNLLDLFVSAWLQHRELAALSNKPGDGELVELIDHRMSSFHEPKVELMLDGKNVFVLPLKIILELEFRGVQLLLHGGRVREVRLGELSGKGSLEIANQQVAQHALGEVKSRASAARSRHPTRGVEGRIAGGGFGRARPGVLDLARANAASRMGH